MKIPYRAEIDGLRAIAVLPVILFHAGFSAFSGGFIGVDIFFVISGYFITYIIVKDVEAGTFSFWAFYERRARRIIPPLFVVILACIPFAWMWMMPKELNAFSTSVVSVCLFLSNVLFWRQSGYFDAAAELKPLLHTWSLAVEEQFYIIFPIAIIILWRFGRNRVLSIALVAAASLAVSQYASIYHPSFNFYWLPTRAWELMAGALCSFAFVRPSALRDNALSIAGLVAIACSIFLFDESTPFPSLYALLPVFGTCAIILFATNGTYVNALLTLKPFVGLGLISYSTYLWHQPLFAFARIRSLTEESSQSMLMLAGLSLLLGYLSRRFVETPIRESKSNNTGLKFSLLQILSITSFLIITLGGVGKYITPHASRGGYIETMKASPKRDECHSNKQNTKPPAQACEYLGSIVRLATFGDSHIVELSYALAEKLKPKNMALKHYSYSGCIPSYGRNLENYDTCFDWTRQSLEYIAAQADIEIVVLSFALNIHLFEKTEQSYPRTVNDLTVKQRQIWESYLSTIKFLQNHNKRIVLVLQSPQLPTHIERIIWKSRFEKGDLIGRTRDSWDAQSQFVLSNLNEIENTNLDSCTKCNAV